MNLGAVTCESPMEIMQDRLSNIIDNAFPVGIPRVRGADVEINGADDGEDFVGLLFQIHDKAVGQNYPIQFRMYESGEFGMHSEMPDGGDVEHLQMIADRAHRSNNMRKEAEREGEFPLYLHNLLQSYAKVIESPKAFTEREPNKTCAHYRYTAHGKGGSVKVIVDTAKQKFRIAYRSGAHKQFHELEMTQPLVQGDHRPASAFLKELVKLAKVSKVWHLGASQLVQQLVEKVPQHTFRHHLVLRPSYHYEVPFCDFVLEKYPDVIVLRAMPDGYQFYRDGQFITGVQNVEEIIAPPLEEEIVARFPQQLWRHGTGILYTSGTLEDIEVDDRRHVKFVPYKRG